MVYSIEEIACRIEPVMARHGVCRAWLFGSYARGTATDSSDVDLLVDTSKSPLTSLGDLAMLYDDLVEALGKKVDLVTLDSMAGPTSRRGQANFREAVNKEKMELYAAA